METKELNEALEGLKTDLKGATELEIKTAIDAFEVKHNEAIELMKKEFTSKQLVVGSNLEPNDRLLRQLGNDALDRLVFSNRPNDGVNLTDSALVKIDGTSHDPHYLIPHGNVNHFGFFNEEDVIDEILNHLKKFNS